MISLNFLSIWIYNLSLGLIMLGIFFCFLRMVLGSTFADRVVALDLTVNILISFIAIYSIISGNSIYLDVVIALALIIFLGTVSFAQFIARQTGSFLNRSLQKGEEKDR